MAPRQRHISQPSLQDDISPVVGTSGAPITVHIDDDDDNDTMNDDSSDDKRISKPLLIAGTKHGTTLVDPTTPTTPIYPTDESSYGTNAAELSRDRHDIFNIVALVSILSDTLVSSSHHDSAGKGS
jgi:hypothetical protein